MRIAVHGLKCSLVLGKPDNEGWMNTVVELEAPSFQGQFSCTVEIEEWRQFIKVPQRLNDSIGEEVADSWSNMEENLHFEFKLLKRAALEGTYRFSPQTFSLGPVLSGSFEADQTFFPRGFGKLRTAWKMLANNLLQRTRWSVHHAWGQALQYDSG